MHYWLDLLKIIIILRVNFLAEFRPIYKTAFSSPQIYAPTLLSLLSAWNIYTEVLWSLIITKIISLHREGILFALSRPGDDEDADPYTPPPYLDFLLVLTEFCHRLLYVDRVGENSGVVPFLYKQLPSDLIDKVRRKELRGWEPLAVYRDLTLPQQTRSTMQRTNRKRPQKGKN